MASPKEDKNKKGAENPSRRRLLIGGVLTLYPIFNLVDSLTHPSSTVAAPLLQPITDEIEPQVIAQSTRTSTNYTIRPVANGMFFTEDGTSGFFMPAEVFDAYSTRGGEAVWGKILSQPYQTNGKIAQVTEKAIWESNKGGQITFANIFDDLHRLEKDAWLDAVRQTPPAQDWPSDRGLSWNGIIGNHLGLVDPYPAFRRTFDVNPDWIDMFGLPVSVKDYGPWVSLRMQRANLQLLKRDLPYGQEGQVLIASGGSVAIEAGGLVPDAALRPRTIDQIGTVVEVQKVIERFGGGEQNPFLIIDYPSNLDVKLVKGKDYAEFESFYKRRLARDSGESVPTVVHFLALDNYFSHEKFISNPNRGWQPIYTEDHQEINFINYRWASSINNGTPVKELWMVVNPQALDYSGPRAEDSRRTILYAELMAGLAGITSANIDNEYQLLSTTKDLFHFQHT